MSAAVPLADERAASAELDYLAAALQPPCALGPFHLTGSLARSATALLFTARGDVFQDAEGVLKLTGSAYAPILRRELALLLEAARAGIESIVRPLADDLVWLSVGGQHRDRPVAAMPLPFLAGGDLAELARRAGRAGTLGPALALDAAPALAEALRGLLAELERPVIHGDVRAQNVLLPAPDARLSALTLIDLDAAHELEAGAPLTGPRLAADVRGFGEILALLATGSTARPTTGNHAFDALVATCLAEAYGSLADEHLRLDLAAAQREQTQRASGGAGFLATLLAGLKRT